MKISNSKKLTGKDIAFLGKRYLELNIKVALRSVKLSDAYSSKKKVIILSEEVCENSSIASAGIVAHELGPLRRMRKICLIARFYQASGRAAIVAAKSVVKIRKRIQMGVNKARKGP